MQADSKIFVIAIETFSAKRHDVVVRIEGVERNRRSFTKRSEADFMAEYVSRKLLEKFPNAEKIQRI